MVLRYPNQVQVNACNDQANQRYRLRYGDLVSISTGMCVSIEGDGTQRGGNVMAGICAGARKSQQFDVLPGKFALNVNPSKSM